MNRVLGRGLSALLNESTSISAKNNVLKVVCIDQLDSNITQPRTIFEDEKIRELSESIRINGLLQPIVVNPSEKGRYKIVAGERRWRACKMAGINEIPVLIKVFSEKEMLEIALIENIQREDLSIIEESAAYHRLIDEFNYTQEELSNKISKSRSYVANLLRLNNLPLEVKEMLRDKKISMGHARCLVNNPDAYEIARYILKKGLNVRQTERYIKRLVALNNKKSNDSGDIIVKTLVKQLDSELDSDLRLIVDSLSKKMNIKITIESDCSGGRLIFHYEDIGELDLILSRLN